MVAAGSMESSYGREKDGERGFALVDEAGGKRGSALQGLVSASSAGKLATLWATQVE